MSKNYSDDELLTFIKDITSKKELFIKLGYTGRPNKIVCNKWYKKYKNLEIDLDKLIDENKKKLNKKSYICKQCGKVFTEKYSKHSSGDFCCKKCAKRYSSLINRETINKKLKEYGKKYSEPYKNEYNKNPKICPICGNIIPYEKRMRETCSYNCGKKLSTLNTDYTNCGGYRKGSGKGKKGYYKGIWCDSTYELAYLIYCLDHNIDIKRCNEVFEYELNGEKHTYHPDFVVEGIITEIKGYDRGDVSIKEMSIGDKEYKLLYGNDLMLCFDYVAKTYNKKYRKKWNNFYELYDEYRPQYEYICDECGKTFNRDKEITTEHKFCCRSCSGKYVNKRYK